MRPGQLFVALFAVTGVIATPIEDSTDWELVADQVAAKYGIPVGDEPVTEGDVTIQTASCYSGGLSWGSNRGGALDNAGNFCTSVNPGAYRPGLTKWRCYNWGGNRNVFGIQNLQDRSIGLSSGACFRFFRGVINKCPRGGTDSNGAWWWRVDPNVGNC